MAQAWSFAGKRVEFRAALPAGKLVVVAPPSSTPEHELKLSQKGEWTLPVAGQTLKVVRTQQFLAPKLELFSPEGTLLPFSPKHLAPSAAPAGSLCAPHQATASYACARCGAFACETCRGADRTHCATCFQALHAAAEKNAAAMVFLAPAALFAVFGGLLGGVLGFAAGGAAVAIAKRTENRAVQILAAVGLYGLATILFLVFVVLVAR
jgi:hypothetical protein